MGGSCEVAANRSCQPRNCQRSLFAGGGEDREELRFSPLPPRLFCTYFDFFFVEKAQFPLSFPRFLHILSNLTQLSFSFVYPRAFRVFIYPVLKIFPWENRFSHLRISMAKRKIMKRLIFFFGSLNEMLCYWFFEFSPFFFSFWVFLTLGSVFLTFFLSKNWRFFIFVRTRSWLFHAYICFPRFFPPIWRRCYMMRDAWWMMGSD